MYYSSSTNNPIQNTATNRKDNNNLSKQRFSTNLNFVLKHLKMQLRFILPLTCIFIYAILSSSCTHTRYIKPLKKGETNISVYNTTPFSLRSILPVALPSASVGYGLTDRTTVYSGIHFAPLTFDHLYLELGIRQHIISFEDKKYIPAISGGLAVHSIRNMARGKIKAYPVLELSPYWESGNWLWFVHSSLWLDFYVPPHEGIVDMYLPNITIGQLYTFAPFEFGLDYQLHRFIHKFDTTSKSYLGIKKEGFHGLVLKFGINF